jgi:hypothetical protein
MRRDVLLGALPERYCLCRLNPAGRTSFLTGVQWIDVLEELLAQCAGFVARLRQAQRMQRAQSHFVAAPVELVSERPTAPDAAIASCDLQIKIAAIRQDESPPPHLRHRCSHPRHAQIADRPPHGVLRSDPGSYPWIERKYTRTVLDV